MGYYRDIGGRRSVDRKDLITSAYYAIVTGLKKMHMILR